MRLPSETMSRQRGEAMRTVRRSEVRHRGFVTTPRCSGITVPASRSGARSAASFFAASVAQRLSTRSRSASWSARTAMLCAHSNRHRGVAQPGRALALGARGRRFRSDRPDFFPRVERREVSRTLYGRGTGLCEGAVVSLERRAGPGTGRAGAPGSVRPRRASRVSLAGPRRTPSLRPRPASPSRP